MTALGVLTAFPMEATWVHVFCHYGMLYRVLFSQARSVGDPLNGNNEQCFRELLFHESKDKREAWKEETRPAPNQTLQKRRRAIDSHRAPSLSFSRAVLYRKG